MIDRSGLVIVDKPAGMTSHDVVGRLRRIMGTKKVGHSGTLDPMATGVLVLGVERGTRFLAHVVTHDKRYEATFALGASTVTDDCEGDFTAVTPADKVTDWIIESISKALATAFDTQRGEIMQRPTSVSSIKINGRRAHELVREGHEVNLPPRPITVFELTWDNVRLSETPNGPRWLVDVSVHCSSGTYIRAIARDIGEQLGLGGYLTSLRRTSVGPFSISDASPLDQLASEPSLSLSLDAAMTTCFPTREITEEQGKDLSLGKWLKPIGLSDIHAAVTPDGRAIALVEERGSRASSVFVARPDGLV